jgi:hypothetical protein
MSTSNQVRQAAIAHAENVMYDSAEAEVVATRDVSKGTRAGLHVHPKGASVKGAVLGVLLGLLVGVVLGLVLVIVVPSLAVPVMLAAVVAGGYVGATRFHSTRYATVTVAPNGDIVLENRDCPKADFDQLIGRQQSADAQGAYHQSRGRTKGKLEAEMQQRFLERMLPVDTSGGPSYSSPDQCPRCQERDTGLGSLFTEQTEGVYQCGNCGHLVDLRPND